MRKKSMQRPGVAIVGCSLFALASILHGCSAADDVQQLPTRTTGGNSTTSTGSGGSTTTGTGTGGATTGTGTTGSGGSTSGGTTTTGGGTGGSGGAGGSGTTGGTGGSGGAGGSGTTGGSTTGVGGTGGAGGSTTGTGGAGGSTTGAGGTGGVGGTGGTGATGGAAGSGGTGGTGATGGSAGAGGSSTPDAGGGKAGGAGSDGGTTPPPGDGGARPPIGSAACGTAPPTNKVGGPAGQFIATDNQGNSVALSDYCGKAVYLDLGAMWCGPCQAAAKKLEARYQKYKDRGFMILSILTENTARKAPSQTDLQTWARTYGLTIPVLNDGTKAIYKQIWPSAGAIPDFALIKPDGIIAKVPQPGVDVTDADIEKVLP